MGSGKTTVGRRLADRLLWRFVDLDHAIEEHVAKSVPRIFAEDGEKAFRQAEATLLGKHLHQPQLVISLGGGAPTAVAVRSLLAADHACKVIHLHAPFPVLYERCVVQATDPQATARPLLSEYATAEQRYLQRLPTYAAIAHLTVDVGCSEAEVVSSILRSEPAWTQSTPG